MNTTVELIQKLMPEPRGGLQATDAPVQVVPAGQKIILTSLTLLGNVPAKPLTELESKQPPESGQELRGENVHVPVLNRSKAKFVPAHAA